MKTCAFFGHGKEDYSPYIEELEEIIVNFIENEGVTQFYSGGRGKFDVICAEIVGNLRAKYPQIKNTLVLSYRPSDKQNFTLHERYDDSVYLLEKAVPPKFAIFKTNEAMVDKTDFIVVAVRYDWGGAQNAYCYAKRKKKQIINLFDLTGEEEALERQFHALIEKQNPEEKMRLWEKLWKKMKDQKK